MTAALMPFSWACQSEEPPRLSLSSQEDAGFIEFTLSQSPLAIAQGEATATTLSANLELLSTDSTFEFIADVASLPDGSFFILDRSAKSVIQFSEQGRRLRRIGREGGGPGEFSNPWAVAVFGEYLVVSEGRYDRPLTVFDTRTMLPMKTSTHGVPAGDWTAPAWREPVLLGLDSPFQMGPEDVTRRLGSAWDSSFIYQLQPNERAVGLEQTSAVTPPVYLVRFDVNADALDTVAVLAGPQTIPQPARFQGERPRYAQPIFSPRPLWTSGSGWVAVANGTDERIVLLGNRRDTLAMIRWPRIDRPITDNDRETSARWAIEYVLREDSKTAGAWERASVSERRSIARKQESVMPFATTAPTVTAMYGAGNCLWIAGFAPADYPDGTSLTWTGIDVVRGELVGTVRVPRRDSRVRHVDEEAFYASFRDSDGLMHLERYPLPGTTCKAGS